MATGVVKRAYKYRFYPTCGQAEQLGGAVERPTAGIVTAVAGCVRQVLAGAEPVSDVQKRGVSKDSATYFANCFTYRGLPDDVVPSQVTMSRNLGSTIFRFSSRPRSLH
ncbi:helix-turn-helix domain-containing protein [Rhodococcus sp. ARC_M6]|uniref:helix-turn-helix domain-containing protein n=1 Tax=Rhodococcus sp. ARC_M6 TaxID=2928852 RepID=UPI001FB3F249|nr:helix-turn-helix domain-containing protein [Rhodococcus sp. ARC_M6]